MTEEIKQELIGEIDKIKSELKDIRVHEDAMASYTRIWKSIIKSFIQMPNLPEYTAVDSKAFYMDEDMIVSMLKTDGFDATVQKDVIYATITRERILANADIDMETKYTTR